ncbi:uncharacterized protein STEHIDRAFT_158400 [Stereum hirsutum FP-91666 SS1]|uniref:uncharacterized protein n=1 Tax=Stereum hirsutum (strain FP-91666) TaxID=721885 RepID=UPI0004449279|nr:uncharacterized protein STEHIDRAFT_158400 [Stereum hirsutum FP-91666 SS1]EIM84683.1 hypothetical protein STEHIDRAFT_158400 [Stereum hirsutum FP-91666 SS1]
MIWLTLIIQTIGIYVVSSPARHDLLNVLNTAVHAALVPSDYTPTSSHPFYTSKPTQHEPKLGSSLSFSGSRSLQLEEHEREILDEEIDDINEAPDSDIALPHPPVVQTDSQPYPFFVSSSGRFMLDFQCICSYPVEGVDAALCRPNPESYRAHFSTAVRDYFCWASSTFWEAMRRSREGSFQGSVALIVIAWEVVDLTLFGGTLPTAALYACVTRNAYTQILTTRSTLFALAPPLSARSQDSAEQMHHVCI